MSLIALKQYIQTQHIASLFDITTHFDMDADTLRPMLAHWERKGCIQCERKTPACGSRCQLCDTRFTELYRYVET